MSVPQEAMSFERTSLWRRLSIGDWLYAAAVVSGTLYVLALYGDRLDRYEIGTLLLVAGAGVWLGWYWKSWRPFAAIVATLSLFGVWLYGNSLDNASNFWLNYIGGGQAGAMWMIVFFYFATVIYLVGLFTRSDFPSRVGTAFAWIASGSGLMALLVRWRETWLNPELAHGYVPVANLYEVFILFCVMTGLMYLYYEQRVNSRTMGGFVMLIIAAAATFLVWYTATREAHVIEPLVPALNSWWMKVHVPANFVGYGGFAIAAMLGVAFLLRHRFERTHPEATFTERLPSADALDSVMYKSIAIGFAFFTIATVLGAMWAAEAWGGYWSWDPKETWALIVWLNYAAWLHMRFTKGWRGPAMAWWAIIGLGLTTFAFIGVNMFLSGLHSYGEL
ncbi:MAG: c-type cytochrome biogenesis protein CcsB [Thioalkalivibrionaceae bacterium]